MLDDARTHSCVSGEQLSLESSKTNILVGLGNMYRKNNFSLSMEFSAKEELGSGGEDSPAFSTLEYTSKRLRDTGNAYV